MCFTCRKKQDYHLCAKKAWEPAGEYTRLVFLRPGESEGISELSNVLGDSQMGEKREPTCVEFPLQLAQTVQTVHPLRDHPWGKGTAA